MTSRPHRRRKALVGTPPVTDARVDADRLRLCREGKHPPTRRIGSACAVCGKLDAWRR